MISLITDDFLNERGWSSQVTGAGTVSTTNKVLHVNAPNVANDRSYKKVTFPCQPGMTIHAEALARFVSGTPKIQIDWNDVNGSIIKSSFVTVDTSDFDFYEIKDIAPDNAVTFDLIYGVILADQGEGYFIKPKLNLRNIPFMIKNGSFTPTLTPGSYTYTEQVGNYTVMGNICYFSARVRISDITSGGTGNLEIDGLPFTCASLWPGVANHHAASVGFAWNIPFGGKDQLASFVQTSTKKIALEFLVTDDIGGRLKAQDLPVSTDILIQITGWYPIVEKELY